MNLNPFNRKDALPYDMFDVAAEAYDAKTADTIENIYHRGQERAWSGREILPMLIEKHGAPDLTQEQKDALIHVFSIIMWGELGAWKIAAQLSDEISPMEARMAATGQAFDEARHFYTLYDYLLMIGYEPDSISRASERILEMTLEARTLAHKVCGMQLMIETIALTLFRTVRETNCEPVLCEMLRYYEIDEARHVGLGVKFLPFLIKDLNPLQRAELIFFQFRLMMRTIQSLHQMQDSLRVLGVDPRMLLARGKAKQFEVFREMYADMGEDITEQRALLDRIFDGVDELFFPEDGERPWADRVQAAWAAATRAKNEFDQTYIEETREEVHSDTMLDGMKKAGADFWARRGKRRKRNGMSVSS